ncbi:MAG: type II toxin-antitoxin system HicA family toxin [Chloroflexi bacterium]|nr:type II toxin-antitoxin system HicA family toxin [Chloroflexota bacterium]
MAGRLPVLRPDEVVRALERAGSVRERRLAHLIMRHPATRRSVPIPVHPGDLKRGLVLSIINQAGLTQDEFRALLRR